MISTFHDLTLTAIQIRVTTNKYINLSLFFFIYYKNNKQSF
jgi:hypothetical protein